METGKCGVPLIGTNCQKAILEARIEEARVLIKSILDAPANEPLSNAQIAAMYDLEQRLSPATHGQEETGETDGAA